MVFRFGKYVFGKEVDIIKAKEDSILGAVSWRLAELGFKVQIYRGKVSNEKCRADIVVVMNNTVIDNCCFYGTGIEMVGNQAMVSNSAFESKDYIKSKKKKRKRGSVNNKHDY